MSSAVAYWRLLRPRGVAWVVCLPLLGAGIGHWDRALDLQDGPGLLAVVSAWFFLHAGTLWLNAALDRDEGEVLLGRPVPVPDGVVAMGWTALVAATLLGTLASPAIGAVTAICAAMAVLYSHPALRLKAHPLGGPTINVLGYGVLSPLAGFLTVRTPLSARAAALMGLLSLWVFATFLAAQAFQEQEDRARGYRTFVALFGPASTLRLARMSAGLAAAGMAALAVAGWIPRITLVAVLPALALDHYLKSWARRRGEARYAGGYVVRLLALGLCVLLSAGVQYALDLSGGGPVAGLATPGGH